MILNSNHIHTIIFSSNKLSPNYTIVMNNNSISGYFFCGSGGINSVDNHIHICATNSPNDYQALTEWINNNVK